MNNKLLSLRMLLVFMLAWLVKTRLTAVSSSSLRCMTAIDGSDGALTNDADHQIPGYG